MAAVVPKALDSASEVVIAAPDKELASLRKTSTNLRNAAAEAKAKVAETGHAAAGGVDKLAAKAGGGLGSLLSKAANAVESVVDKTAEIAGGGLEHALIALADALDGQLTKLDGKFSTVGKDVLENKKEDISATYNELISACAFEGAQSACQSKGTDGISESFHTQMMPQLTEKMAPHVKAAAAGGVAAAWNSAIEKVNSANEKLGSTEWGAKYKQEPINLDINKHINEQIWTKLGAVCGKKEAELRSAPGDNKLLSTCLAKKGISKPSFDAWKKGNA